MNRQIRLWGWTFSWAMFGLNVLACGHRGSGGSADGGGISDSGSNAGLVAITLVSSYVGLDAGVVVSQPAGLSCGSNCTLLVPPGTAITLDATSLPLNVVGTWTGACSAFDNTCTLVAEWSDTVRVEFRPYNLAFFVGGGFQTGVLGDGDGGVSLADRLCANTAYTLGYPAGHSVAWLSTSTVDARSRIPSGVRGWVIPGNSWFSAPVLPAFDQLSSALADHQIYYPIELFYGGWPNYTMSGTSPDGTNSTSNCLDWTSNDAGLSYSTGWPGLFAAPGDAGFLGCDNPSSFLCLQIDYNSPMPSPLPNNHPRAFVTDGVYPSGGGLRAFDTACADEAADAGLTGNYIAYVATSIVSPAARNSTPEFARLDGVRVSNSLVPPLTMTPSGRYLVPSFADATDAGDLVWTGTGNPYQASGYSVGSCVDWLSTSGQASVGSASDFPNTWGWSGVQETSPCDAMNHLYCIEK